MPRRLLGPWCVALALLAMGGSTARAANSGALVQAVQRADAKAVRALLQQHADVNAPEADGSTALHWAADAGDVAIVDLLLKAGAKAALPNRYGVTPLSLACTNGNADVIDHLLKAGADANATMDGGETALMTAARTGRADAMKVLLAHGAKVDARESTRGQTALMWAAAEGNVDAIKTLAEAGADLHATSDEKDFRFKMTGNGGARSGAPTPLQFTPLMFAVRAGHQEAVQTLLGLGASVNEQLPDGTPALMVAIINAHWELAGSLLDKGANPNADPGWTPLHQLARSRSLTVGHVPPPTPTGHMSSLELAKKLIEKGANVNARVTKDGMLNDRYRTDLDRVGATPYLLAAKGVDHELMRLLLANGADPKIPNRLEMTPLMVAAGVAMHSVGEDSGTDEDALEAVAVALNADPNVNATDKRGQTALHGAAFRGAVPVIQLLLAHGAKPDARIKREDFVGQSYGDRGFLWTPLTVALGRQKDGKPIFLGGLRHFDAALVLYRAMKRQGLPVDEDPFSVAELEQQLKASTD